MTVKAKFQCVSILDLGNENKQFKFSAAVAGDENKDWSKWTPSGDLSMHITNPDASSQFVVGKAYYLTFEPA